MTKTTENSSTFNTLLSAAIIFLLLGLGNMFFGNSRADEYRSLLKLAHTQEQKQSKPLVPLVNSALSVDAHSEHVNRLSSRINYYDLVTLGGKVFLAIAGVLLLMCLIMRRGSEETEH